MSTLVLDPPPETPMQIQDEPARAEAYFDLLSHMQTFYVGWAPEIGVPPARVSLTESLQGVKEALRGMRRASAGSTLLGYVEESAEAARGFQAEMMPGQDMMPREFASARIRSIVALERLQNALWAGFAQGADTVMRLNSEQLEAEVERLRSIEPVDYVARLIERPRDEVEDVVATTDADPVERWKDHRAPLRDLTRDVEQRETKRAYTHTNSWGVAYVLNAKTVVLRGGIRTTIYYFSKNWNPATAATLPENCEVNENPRNGFLRVERSRR